MRFQPLDRYVDAVGALQMFAHRGLRQRQPAAAGFQFEENHLPIGSGELQIGPAGDDAEPREPARGDRIAIFA